MSCTEPSVTIYPLQLLTFIFYCMVTFGCRSRTRTCSFRSCAQRVYLLTLSRVIIVVVLTISISSTAFFTPAIPSPPLVCRNRVRELRPHLRHGAFAGIHRDQGAHVRRHSTCRAPKRHPSRHDVFGHCVPRLPWCYRRLPEHTSLDREAPLSARRRWAATLWLLATRRESESERRTTRESMYSSRQEL
jgi:hypothetical protein